MFSLNLVINPINSVSRQIKNHEIMSLFRLYCLAGTLISSTFNEARWYLAQSRTAHNWWHHLVPMISFQTIPMWEPHALMSDSALCSDHGLSLLLFCHLHSVLISTVHPMYPPTSLRPVVQGSSITHVDHWMPNAHTGREPNRRRS